MTHRIVSTLHSLPRHVTLTRLARAAGLNIDYVRQLKRGNRTPSAEAEQLLCEALARLGPDPEPMPAEPHAYAALQDILQRLPEGLSQAELARLARMHPSHLDHMKHRRRGIPRGHLTRLRLALTRLKMRAVDGPAWHVTLYRLLLVRSAQALRLDPAQVLAADALAKDRSYAARRLSDGRWLAWYLMNTACDFQQADVARAAGVSKQAVSAAVQEIERLREPEGCLFDQLVAGLEAELVGAR